MVFDKVAQIISLGEVLDDKDRNYIYDLLVEAGIAKREKRFDEMYELLTESEQFLATAIARIDEETRAFNTTFKEQFDFFNDLAQSETEDDRLPAGYRYYIKGLLNEVRIALKNKDYRGAEKLMKEIKDTVLAVTGKLSLSELGFIGEANRSFSANANLFD